MSQYIHLAKANMALVGNQKRRKGPRENPVKENIHLFSSGISRKLAFKVASFLLPMTLITLFAVYQIAAHEADDTGRAAAINETESLLGSNASATSNLGYAESPDIAALNKLNRLFTHGKIDAEELHFLLQESEIPLQIPAWLELAASRIKTTPDNGIKAVLNSHAQYFLGRLYANGLGVEKDFNKAVHWFTLAAEKGYKNAIMSLGKIYAEELGQQGYAKAMHWYHLAAEDNHAPAQFSVGEIFMRQGGTAGEQQALKWYFLAAENGYAPAQFNLGEMYANGIGVQKDYATALKWYFMAAQQANPFALASLGRLHEEGRGVPQDFALAHMWFNLAAAKGLNFAQNERDRLAQKMPATQVAEAQAMARDYVQKYYQDED